jgi:hypothetical protein
MVRKKKKGGIFGKARSEEYRKIRNNINAKLKRIQKNYGVDESETIHIPNKEDFRTLKEYNAWKKDMKWFTNRNNIRFKYEKNEYGVVANIQEIREAEQYTKLAQKKAKELQSRMEDKPYFHKGEEIGTVGERRRMLGESEKLSYRPPADFNFSKMKSRKDFEERLEIMEEKATGKFYEEKTEQMLENYIKKVKETFNSDGDNLVALLETISPDDFYELYNMNKEMEFSYYYTTYNVEGRSHNDEITRLESVLEEYFEGKTDMDLKGF